jgi:hypothetical protein
MMRVNGSTAHVPLRRISFGRAVLAAALLVPGYASNVLASGTVSGQITSSVTDTGIAGAKVQFYRLDADDDGPFATATADGSGNYSQELPDGTYGLLTQNTQGYINKIWNNVSCSATCDLESITPVVVSGGNVTGINFELDPGGRISGTITSSVTGNPIPGVLVFFLDSGRDVAFSTATTDSLGHYTSDGGSGSGSVFVITSNGQGYRDEAYNDRKCTIETCDTPDPVSVTLGATTGGIDFALDPGGRISGTVRDIGNAPLANVAVQIYDSTGEHVDEVLTDASGNFITSGHATGTYYVSTRNRLGLVDYVWNGPVWNGLLCAGGFCNQTAGSPVSVTVPATTGGINFVLTPGQTISGTVTAAAGGAPITDVFVGVLNSSGLFVGGARTNDSGSFTTGALPPGTYYATTSANGYVGQQYDHLSCSGCPVTNGTLIVVSNQPVTDIDFSLLAIGTGSITGTVTDGFNGNLPTGLSVQLITPTGAVASTTTTNNGVYTFNNVSAGSYYVRTNAPAGGIPFVNQMYNGVTCVNCSIFSTAGITPVTVSSGAATTGIDFTLQRGGVITGTITIASNGTPLSGIGAQVFNSAGVSVGTFNSNASGVYTSAGLPAGTYYVRTVNFPGYINQQWQGLPCPQAACLTTAGTPVVVNGTTVSGIDFALTAGGRISGKVTDASNSQGLPNVSVQIFSSAGVNLGGANTDASGNYTTSGLPPGTYFLRTASGPLFVNNQSLAFVDQLYTGTQCVPACLNPTAGTPVTVTAFATTSGIDFALARGGSIAGGVIDADTAVGLAVVPVHIYTAAGILAKAVTTNRAGGYTVAGLPPGTYYARTSMGGGVFYQDELYNGMPCSSGCLVTAGTPITVLAGLVSNGVDFALSPGAGGMSGTVTDSRTGAPLPGVLVEIYTASGTFTKFAFTGLAGTYATSGLAPGTYYARTLQPVPTGHTDEVYSGVRCGWSCTVTNGTPIVVTTGATTIGIDFALGGFALGGLPSTGDFDADGRTDIAVWRASTGTWYVVNSSNDSVTWRSWGFADDIRAPGDYDGDGKIDVAVWRPSNGYWYIVNSSDDSVTAQQWGSGPIGDIPVPADYDGDGRTDIAVWRASTGTWYIVNSSDGSVTVRTWGFAAANDVPVAADYDGDGKADIAVWRASTGVWYVVNSADNSVTVRSWGFGFAPYNDVPVPADYDGDGKTDIAVWRASTGVWYIINSSDNSVTARQWGISAAPSSDIPVPGDYDGDGKTDIAVWRSSTGYWYIVNSSDNSVTARPWGLGPNSDVPVPSSGIR